MWWVAVGLVLAALMAVTFMAGYATCIGDRENYGEKR